MEPRGTTPQLDELCDAYASYRAQTIDRHRDAAFDRLGEAAKAFAESQGWQQWEMVLILQKEMCSCKRSECGDLHVRTGRRPGLYINGKSLQEIVDECNAKRGNS